LFLGPQRIRRITAGGKLATVLDLAIELPDQAPAAPAKVDPTDQPVGVIDFHLEIWCK